MEKQVKQVLLGSLFGDGNHKIFYPNGKGFKIIPTETLEQTGIGSLVYSSK